MTTAVIVQARFGSTRLPGKVLLDLGGRTVLHRVLQRCRDISGVDAIVCAVPDKAASGPIEDVAKECGAKIFRGAENDVLDRYLGAARAIKADIVLRVTSDCPLIDPAVCGQVLALRARENSDYAANNMPRSFPLGLDCEAFTLAALTRAAGTATDTYDREHVTPWLRRADGIRRVNLSSGNAALAAHRWTLDYPEDIDFFRAVSARLPDIGKARMADVLDLLARHPEIAQINAKRHENAQG
jgi:glutamate-1-semialdehyde 2,1-aminomutase/spore coat polysaccharide biosynthesis protein SpsF